MKMNFITVCTDMYPMLYAEKISRRMQTVTNLEFDYYCLTDRPSEVGEWATALDIPVKTDGWWNKLNLFSANMPSGWLIYMDIDIVINANFDDEIRSVIEMDKDVSCVSDAIGWMGEKFSSSFMIIKSGSCQYIYDNFVENISSVVGKDGGDQVWVGPQLKEVNYIDELFPNLKKNLKFDLARQEGNKIILPKSISEDIKLVDCGGRPKPHELHSLPYIERNWHQVPVD